VDGLSGARRRADNDPHPAFRREGAAMRILRAFARAFTGFGWVLTPPAGPYDLGTVVPLPRPAASADVPSVPLSARERETFWRIVGG
jgi:hypothetical protein